MLDGAGEYMAFQSGSDVHITSGTGSEMVLQNVQLASLAPGWIATG